MSRHRIVRSMNYDEERYDDDEYEYGHSYEDRYCVSPSTAAQFTFNRDQGLDLSSFMHEERIPEEEEETMETDQVEGAVATMSEALSDLDKARLHSCLEELRNVLGETVPEAVLTETVIRHNYNIQTTLNEIFSLKEAPKPQRTERRKRDRTQEDDKNIDELLSEIDSLDKQEEQLPFINTGGRFLFREGFSPPGDGEGKVKVVDAGQQSSAGTVQNLQQKVNTLSVSPPEMKVSVSNTPSGAISRASAEKHSSPIGTFAKQNKTLSELVSERKTDEQPKTSGVRGPESNRQNSALSLTQLVGLHGKQNTSYAQPQPQSGLSSQKQGASILSLTELVNLHSSKKMTGTNPSISLQESSKKGREDERMTLSKLIRQQVPRGSSSPSGVSLADLVKGSTADQMSPMQSSLIPKSADTQPEVKPSLSGLSLAGLAKNQTGNKHSESLLKHQTFDSGSGGVSLLDLAKRHTEGKGTPGLISGHGTNSAFGNTKSSGVSSGPSLSDLVKQHQGSRSNRVSLSSGKEMDSSKVEDPAVSNLRASFKGGLTLKPDVQLIDSDADSSLPEFTSFDEQQQQVKGKGEAELSLALRLKKSLKVRPTEENSMEIPENSGPKSESADSSTHLKSPTSAEKEPVFSFEPVVFDRTLKLSPSLFARCICLHWEVQSKRRACDTRKKPRFSKFRYKFQTRKLQPAAVATHHQIKPFDFGVPSPDDYVKIRQRAAFTRTGQAENK